MLLPITLRSAATSCRLVSTYLTIPGQSSPLRRVFAALTRPALRRWVAQDETDAGRGRRVVGWALRNRITRELAVEALTMALAHRQPDPGLMHHSDRFF